jgi:protein O-GlcNAc transferase
MDEARLAQAKELHRLGRAAEALAHYRDLCIEEPERAELWYLASLAEHELGRATQARESVDRALALAPDQPHFRLHSGHVAVDSGDTLIAERDLRRATDLRPDWAPAWASLGTMLFHLQRVSEAQACFEKAVALDPGRARNWNNLGLAFADLGRQDDATRAFERALALDPAYGLAHLNLARTCDSAGKADEAIAHAREACRLAPRHAEAHVLAGDLYRKRRDAANALASYRSAIGVAPRNAKARNALAEMLWETGAVEEARREFAANRRDHPGSLKAALGSELLLPAVYAGKEHLGESRARYREGLERLVERREDFRYKRAGDALDDIRWTNFYLAYQGQNDRELQSRYGDFIGEVLAKEAPEFLAERKPRARVGSRLRVGFLSHFFFNCTAGRYFASWVLGLDTERVESFVYYTNPWVADDTRAIAAAAAHFRHLPKRSLQAIARQVLEDDLDVLVYPELGMHPDVFALASLRLAPVQCAGWGHPTTTGLPTIDWYLSCESMEPEGAQAHYRERLALLPGLGTNYARPSGEADGNRADFGLPEDRHLYLVPQSIFKIHPDNDALIADVLAADPRGLAVLFDAGHPALLDAFAARIAPVLAARGLSTERHLLFLPYVTHGQYLRVNRLCDVMLDTLHWSGGNTSLDALAMALPVVTLPGGLMRGRQSLGMLRTLGVEDVVAKDRDDFVRLAARLGADREWRRDVYDRIAAGTPGLFDRREPVQAFQSFLEMAANGGPLDAAAQSDARSREPS